MRAQHSRRTACLKARMKARTMSPAFTSGRLLCCTRWHSHDARGLTTALRAWAAWSGYPQTVRFRVLCRDHTPAMTRARLRGTAGAPGELGPDRHSESAPRREAIRSAVFQPRLGGASSTKRSAGREASPPEPVRRADTVASSAMGGVRHEALIELGEVRRRLGGIGSTLARRVLEDLPVIHLGDRVLIRERSLDEYIRQLDAEARQRRFPG